jgi:hypothetical protein
MTPILFALSAALTLVSCTPSGAAEDPEDKTPKPMYELAINQSKEGQHQAFLDTRQRFVDVLANEPATRNEGKWTPFFTVVPDLDLDRILIGMTHWTSLEGFGEAAARLMPQEEARAYFGTFDPLAYALLEPLDGKPFNMETIKREGLVVEFAIREATTEGAFGAPRDAFFATLERYDGFRFAREFRVHELDAQGTPRLAENTQAVIIVWDDPARFQAAAEPIFASPEYAAFAGQLSVKTYFACSPAE